MSDNDTKTLPKTVTIPTAEYLRMFESVLTLHVLQAAGVDNWEGYGEADWDWVEQRMTATRDALPGQP